MSEGAEVGVNVRLPAFCTLCVAAVARSECGTSFKRDSELTQPSSKGLAAARNSGPSQDHKRKSFVTSLCLIFATFFSALSSMLMIPVGGEKWVNSC